MAIQQRDREEWFFHPVTQEFLRLVRDSRHEAMEAWARQAFVSDNPQQTLQYNANALGGVDAMNQVIEMIDGYKPVDPATDEEGVM